MDRFYFHGNLFYYFYLLKHIRKLVLARQENLSYYRCVLYTIKSKGYVLTSIDV